MIAGFGAGTVPAPLAELAREMARTGCVIVVSSRVGEVTVVPETTTLREDAAIIASGFLNPQKSALLLALALAAGMRAEQIATIFERFYSVPPRERD